MKKNTITLILKGDIPLAEFADAIKYFQGLKDDGLLAKTKEEAGIHYTFGSVTGVVDTISRRNGFVFTLYDDIFDRAVRCHVSISQQEKLRGIWGERVKVIGFIHRDPETGRVASVKDIKKIDIISSQKDQYRQARGVVPYHPDDEAAEKIIRQLRDVS